MTFSQALLERAQPMMNAIMVTPICSSHRSWYRTK